MHKLSPQQGAAFQEHRSKIDDLVSELNAAIDDFNTFRQEVNDAQESYFDERSEAWQEGDAGSDYTAWMDAWACDMDPIDEPDWEQFPESWKD